MPKTLKMRKIQENPFAFPVRDNTSDPEKEYSDTLSFIQAKNIPLFPKMTPNVTSVVLTPLQKEPNKYNTTVSSQKGHKKKANTTVSAQENSNNKENITVSAQEDSNDIENITVSAQKEPNKINTTVSSQKEPKKKENTTASSQEDPKKKENTTVLAQKDPKRSKNTVSAHKEPKNSNNTISTQEEYVLIPGINKKRCDICKRGFTNVKLHKRKTHKLLKRPAECCGMKFLTGEEFKKHKKTHIY